jgi:hypothetical protein
LVSRPAVAAVAAVVVVVGATATGYALRHRPVQATAVAERGVTERGPAPAAGPTSLRATPGGPTAPRPAAAGRLSTAPGTSRAPATHAGTPARSSPPAGGSGPAPAGGVSAKKGVSAWRFTGVTAALKDVGAAWYYTWGSGPDGIAAPAGVQFVPMIWGAKSVTGGELARARQAGGAMLGFNEPDLAGQADMSVPSALALWPKLAATGLRLGSPAPAFGAATPGGWFDQFMSGAAARGYRVDFIALHWYGSDFSAAATGQLHGYLQAVHDRYHKPIWLTEYALINFSGTPKYPTDAQQAAFIAASTAMLQGLPYVERYAWFSLPVGDGGTGTGLYRANAVPTAAGRAYRAAG